MNSEIEITNVIGDDILCGGSNSCAGATLRLTDTVSYGGVELYGYLSGQNAKIFGTRVDAYGYRAAAFSTIDSKGQIDMRVSGAQQGLYGATVICRNETVGNSYGCRISCGANTCENMDLICLPGSKCVLFPTGCMGNSNGVVDGSICPNILTQITNEQELEEFLEKKEMEKKMDDVWIEIQQEMMEYEMEIDEDEGEMELVMIHDNDAKSEDTDMLSLIGISGGSLIVFSLLCLWNKRVRKENEYQSIE